MESGGFHETVVYSYPAFSKQIRKRQFLRARAHVIPKTFCLILFSVVISLIKIISYRTSHFLMEFDDLTLLFY